VGFVVDKVAPGLVFPSTSVSLANSHSTIIYHLWLEKWANNGRHTKSTPAKKLKKKKISTILVNRLR
jgi:hypothetical protein